jgi:hypothetical protein
MTAFEGREGFLGLRECTEFTDFYREYLAQMQVTPVSSDITIQIAIN